jgi:hypothetical protein
MGLKDQKYFLTCMLLIIAKVHHLDWVIMDEGSFEKLFCRMQCIDEKHLKVLLYENNYIHSLPNKNNKRIHAIIFFLSTIFVWRLLIRNNYSFLSNIALYFMCKYAERDAPRWLKDVGCFRSYTSYWRQWKIILCCEITYGFINQSNLYIIR